MALPLIPSDPKFIIPDDSRRTYDNEQFLLYDKRKTAYGGRLLIFVSEEQLRVLLQSGALFADGTFKVAPRVFEQLYIIHGFQHGEGTFVLLFILQSAISVCIRRENRRKQQRGQ